MITNGREIFDAQKEFFFSGKTLSYEFRHEMLRKLLRAVTGRQNEILEALKKDLGRHETEGYLTEYYGIVHEIQHVLKKLKKWMKPKSVMTDLHNFPSRGRIHKDPLGVNLIISPWNYPFLLALKPLIGAIAGGNTVMLKPSEISIHSTEVLDNLIKDTFEPCYITSCTGGVKVATELLKFPFDHIFFTGSTTVGKIVMEAASKHLSKVTLELGGKSPALLSQEADLEASCKKIVWGKFLNAGQTCVAPDYLLVHESIYEQSVSLIKHWIEEFYSDENFLSPDYGRIISEAHFHRLKGYYQKEELLYGGKDNREERYLSPTLLKVDTFDHPVMKEEIFGPILPIMTYRNFDEMISILKRKEKPLAAYYFGNDEHEERLFLEELQFGGGCINDTIVHLSNKHLPFGGVGPSGLGSYHGKKSFETFTHEKSVLTKFRFMDPALRYPPYKTKLKFLKWFLR